MATGSPLTCFDCIGSFFCSFFIFLGTFQLWYFWLSLELSSCLSELPPEDKDESQKIMLFGAKLAQGQIEATVITLAVAGVVLFLVACFLLGVVIYLERQKRLRRNRRSILDDGFKLMSKKNLEL